MNVVALCRRYDLTFSRMPYVTKKSGKSKSKPRGIGATARAKKSSKGYGSKGIDWEAAMKLADAAAAKMVNKTIETQYSQALIRMLHSGALSPPSSAFSGFTMAGLNQIWNQGSGGVTIPAAAYNRMLMWNLSALSQVKPQSAGSISGWRQGNKINALALTFNLVGAIDDLSADCDYHIMVVRRKDGGGTGSVYQTPFLTNSDLPSLYKPITDGPFAGNYGDSTTTPVSHYLSMMRRNTDAWSFVEKGHTSKHFYASPQGNLSGSSITMNAEVNMSLYIPLGATWDFVSATPGESPVLKGGDYYVFVWREGPADTQMEQSLNLYVHLAFKDA